MSARRGTTATLGSVSIPEPPTDDVKGKASPSPVASRESSTAAALGLLVKLRLSADVGRRLEACPCRGPLLDQPLPTFRRGAR